MRFILVVFLFCREFEFLKKEIIHKDIKMALEFGLPRETSRRAFYYDEDEDDTHQVLR